MFGGSSLAPQPPAQQKQQQPPKARVQQPQTQKVASWGAPAEQPKAPVAQQQFSSRDVRSQKGRQSAAAAAQRAQQQRTQKQRTQKQRGQQRAQPAQRGNAKTAAAGRANFAVGMGAGLLGVASKGGAKPKAANYKSDFSLVDAETSAFADLKARFIAEATVKAEAKATAYDKNTSFFDSISSSTTDRQEVRVCCCWAGGETKTKSATS